MQFWHILLIIIYSIIYLSLHRDRERDRDEGARGKEGGNRRYLNLLSTYERVLNLCLCAFEP